MFSIESGPRNFINDIALLRLVRPVEVGPTVNTLCLPPPSAHEEDFEETVVFGWGKTESDTNSEVLQELPIQGGNSKRLKRARKWVVKASLERIYM